MNLSADPSIVIIGLGPAGMTALEGIREHDADVPVIIVSGEPHHAYFRPRLSHLLGSEILPEQIAVKPRTWYDERRASVLLGRAARGIDTDQRAVVLDDGERLSARAVVMACGSSPFVPPLPGRDREGVFSLRTAADAQAITEACRRARTVCVVGAGPLGLEAAWALAKLGVAVHLLEHGPRLLAKMLDEPTSQMLSDIVASVGIELHLSAASEAVTPEGVRLVSGEVVPGEVVLFSTGVRPNLELARSAGIGVNRGVVVDSNMRTSAPWIFAAGDVAEFAGAPGGTWLVAMAQGKVAGVNAAKVASVAKVAKAEGAEGAKWAEGAEGACGAVAAAGTGTGGAAGALAEYIAVPPSYTLMVMGTRIFTVGEVQDSAADGVMTVISEDADRRIRRKLVLRDGKLVGALLFGDLAKSDKVRDGVERGVELPVAGLGAAPDYADVMEMLIGALATGV